MHGTLRLAKPPNIQVTTTSRSYKHVSTGAICEDIRSLLLSKHLPDVTNYDVTCTLKHTTIIDVFNIFKMSSKECILT